MPQTERDDAGNALPVWPWLLDLEGKDAKSYPNTTGSLWMFLQEEVLADIDDDVDLKEIFNNFRGERYPRFADLWRFLVECPWYLPSFEGLCRMEAAASNRKPLAVHPWRRWKKKA